LAKRTVSESDPTPASATSSDSKANPFGAAKPIDTATREKEIEEKRQLAIRQKQEQADKARDEKRAEQAAARAAEKEKGVQTPTTPKEASKEAKENGEDKPAATYEILRRIDDENGQSDEPQDDAVDASANGNIVDDKQVKPKEIVRNPPKAEAGAWRRKTSTPATPNESTSQVMEDDGWSTVPQKSTKGRRGGPQGSRAIAS
jgi:translation initiation factor 4B